MANTRKSTINIRPTSAEYPLTPPRVPAEPRYERIVISRLMEFISVKSNAVRQLYKFNKILRPLKVVASMFGFAISDELINPRNFQLNCDIDYLDLITNNSLLPIAGGIATYCASNIYDNMRERALESYKDISAEDITKDEISAFKDGVVAQYKTTNQILSFFKLHNYKHMPAYYAGMQCLIDNDQETAEKFEQPLVINVLNRS
jgi:hypothetical protein